MSVCELHVTVDSLRQNSDLRADHSLVGQQTHVNPLSLHSDVSENATRRREEENRSLPGNYAIIRTGRKQLRRTGGND